MSEDLDLGYLRDHPETIDRLIEHQRIRETPIPGGDVCRAQRLTLDDGTSLFEKTRPGAPPEFFPSEAAGLGWLGAAGPGSVAVPQVVAATPTRLVLEWIEPGPITPDVAEALGRGLALMHAAGAEAYGAPWPGFIGRQPLDNTAAESWPEFFAEQRVRPYLRAARDRGAITGADARSVERVLDRVDDRAGPPEPPARIHGDLWGGNLLADRAGRPYVIDPAAHGGHRETDLAMLALFGAPHLARLLAAYDEVHPLADGWRQRVGLHQLHPLLVHAVTHGESYGAWAGAVARELG